MDDTNPNTAMPTMYVVVLPPWLLGRMIPDPGIFDTPEEAQLAAERFHPQATYIPVRKGHIDVPKERKDSEKPKKSNWSIP